MAEVARKTVWEIKDPDRAVYLLATGRAASSPRSGTRIGGRPLLRPSPSRQASLPRRPAVYERKRKWRSLDETSFQRDKEDYKSAAAVADLLEQQFQEKAALGMMFRGTPSRSSSPATGSG